VSRKLSDAFYQFLCLVFAKTFMDRTPIYRKGMGKMDVVEKLPQMAGQRTAGYINKAIDKKEMKPEKRRLCAKILSKWPQGADMFNEMICAGRSLGVEEATVMSAW
jgi:hypothetical protein